MSIGDGIDSEDLDSWDTVLRSLYSVAFEVARTRLGDALRSDCEEVANEALLAMVRRFIRPGSEAEMKAFVAAIACNKATDRLRRNLAAKRGTNATVSLDALRDEGVDPVGVKAEDFFQQISADELRGLLFQVSEVLDKKHRIVLREHYLCGMSYAEIAAKHNISSNSVGVYLQRGLETFRAALARSPGLLRDLAQHLEAGGVVRVVLPLVSAIQLGGWIAGAGYQFQEFSQLRFSRETPLVDNQISDEERLQLETEALPVAVLISRTRHQELMDEVGARVPEQYMAWRGRKEAAEEQRSSPRGCFAVFVLMALVVSVVLALGELGR